jgi:hypothetical protein
MLLVVGVQTDRILSDHIWIRIRIIADIDIRIHIFLDINTDTDNFLSDTNMNTLFNLEPDMDTGNYPDPNIFKIWISG